MENEEWEKRYRRMEDWVWERRGRLKCSRCGGAVISGSYYRWYLGRYNFECIGCGKPYRPDDLARDNGYKE